MVSIGLIIERNTDYEYVINMITAQVHDSIEIICSLDEAMEISSYDILECIRMHRGKNMRRVHMICSKKTKSYAERIKDIVEVSRGEYVLIHLSKDWLYNPEALRLLSEETSEKDDIIVGLSILYEEGTYIGESYFTKKDEEEADVNKDYSIVDAITSGLPILIKRSFLDQKLNIESALDLDNVKIKVTSVPCLCHETLLTEVGSNTETKIVNDGSAKLNFTGYTYLSNLLIRVYKGRLSRKAVFEEIDVVNKYIVGKQLGGSWDITNSDKKLLFHLDQIRDLLESETWSKYDVLKKMIEVWRNSAKQIKIVILAQEYMLWPSIKTVYDAARRNPKFSVDLVYVPFSHMRKEINHEEEILKYLDAGYPIKRWDEYNLSKSSPDVAIMIKPYDSVPKEFFIRDIDKIVRRVVFIRYAPSVNFVMNERLEELLFNLPAFFLMWKCLAYTKQELERATQCSFRKGREWITIGHPRDDLSVKDLNTEEKNYYKKIKRLAKGRKIFLWNTAAIPQSEAELVTYASFMEWGERILHYFEMHEDVFLLWRPHPTFFVSLIQYWGEERCNLFIKRVENVKNVYIDEFKQYTPAFLASDAFISDTSSMVDLYIPTMRPILLTKLSNQSLNQYDEGFLKAIHVLENEDDIKNFVNVVGKKYNKTNKSQADYVGNNYYSRYSSKKVSQRLLEEITDGIKIEESILYQQRDNLVGEIRFK